MLSSFIHIVIIEHFEVNTFFWSVNREDRIPQCHSSPLAFQTVDMLWSDPMPQDGCMPNEVRGGGCCWGPDVTEEVLQRHNLRLLINAHECKQDGYEFCHNRRVSI